MRVRLLGTGAADGWPNPFCRCRSCGTERAAGRSRGQTAALVDGSLLLDCGPQTPAAASRFGIDLASVTDVFLTHAHPDHTAPAVALWRSWAATATSLRIHGPAEALHGWSDWIGPQDPVTLHPLRPGDQVAAGPHRVTALAATHGEGALLYRVTGADASLLYATDTGPLPAATVAALADAHLDLLLLELTFGPWLAHGTDHLDNRSFPEQLARLREVAAIDDRTDVVAVHLSHHNPPGEEFAAVLRGWAARAVPDGSELTPGSAAATGEPPGAHRPQRTLILGGARSGKSATAERMLATAPRVRYVATGVGHTDDLEWVTRIAAHRSRRPPRWQTVETTDLVSALADAEPGDAVLIDCLALWTTAVVDTAGAWEDPSAAESAVADAVSRLIPAWRECAAVVVAVSNEVGSGVVPATPAGRIFRDCLGQVNAAVAAQSEQVLLVTAGIAHPLRTDVRSLTA